MQTCVPPKTHTDKYRTDMEINDVVTVSVLESPLSFFIVVHNRLLASLLLLSFTYSSLQYCY